MPRIPRPPNKKPRDIRRIGSLSSTEFEHLIFDLMVARGMTNVAWRTPGPDGGRDIEGITYDIDLSGVQSTKVWFIECKRYARAVDWPTIYEKVAYAVSHQADTLLLCSTSSFSPAAMTQVAQWNSNHRTPAIRLWPRHELEVQLQRHPDLMLKYGLSNFTSTPGRSFVSLALALAKSVSSHYSRLVFNGSNPDLMLQAAQMFADLLTIRMEDIERAGRIDPIFPRSYVNTLEHCSFDADHFDVDEPGLKAFVAYLAALTSNEIRITFPDKTTCVINASTPLAALVERYMNVFSAISIWSDFETDLVASTITIRQRR